jgi:cytochrome c oxidase subunit II
MKKHTIILTVLIGAISAAVAYFFLNHSLIPRPASTQRGDLDNLFNLLNAIGGIIFVLVIVLLFYIVIVFRRRGKDTTDGPPQRGFFPLELTWTLIPLAIVISLGIYSGTVLHKMDKADPANSQQMVYVTAFQWGWQFEYPQYAITSYELHMPVNQQVMLHIKSRDVVHSFWIPEMGPKQDAVPGMTTMLLLNPTKVGQYHVQCSQLCGLYHSYMTAPAIVSSADDFQKWVAQQQKSTK